MQVTERLTRRKKQVNVRILARVDFRKISKGRYSFDWRKVSGAEIYKIILTDGTILGLIALTNVPGESRIECKLLATSIENRGANKKYEGIAGCLLSFACRMAIRKYGELACVSLIPKTELKKHYISTYGMLDGGRHVYLDSLPLIRLIEKYP